jgi:hypothetical protein
VKRINAQVAAAARRTEAELRAVRPPDALTRPHAALLPALDEWKTASLRLSKASRGAAPGRDLVRALEAQNAARERADRAAARLGLTDCRERD